MSKNKVVVYGLGQDYQYMSQYLEAEFEIIGYSDKVSKDGVANFIRPEDLNKFVYDYIFITSSKYFNDIKHELCDKLGREVEKKIITREDVFGDFRNSQVRDQWIIEKIQKIPAGQVLLDAGAGCMRYKPYCGHLKYIAQDFGKYDPFSDGKWDTSGIDIKCDITDIPLKNESVDTILCSEVFEHLKNPILAVKEFSRILRPGGVLLLTAPVCSLTHQAPYYFNNGFSEFWYKENLKDYGFFIEELTKNGNFFLYLCQELFRVGSMTKQYCNRELSNEEAIKIIDSIKVLSGLSAIGGASDEGLCFGIMVVARKEA